VFGAQYAMAAIDYGRGDYKKAAELYRQAALGHPDHFYAPQALLDAGKAYRRLSRTDDAKRMFGLILKNYSKSREANDARSELAELEFIP